MQKSSEVRKVEFVSPRSLRSGIRCHVTQYVTSRVQIKNKIKDKEFIFIIYIYTALRCSAESEMGSYEQ